MKAKIKNIFGKDGETNYIIYPETHIKAIKDDDGKNLISYFDNLKNGNTIVGNSLLLDGHQYSDFTSHINLTSTLQIKDYRRSVIALCEVSPKNTSINSYSSGTLVFHRSNGLDEAHCKAEVFMYGSWRNNNGVECYIYEQTPKKTISIKPVTFSYNNKIYGGVEVDINNAQVNEVYFDGTTNFNIFALDYYSNDPNIINVEESILNEEVYNSLSDNVAYLNYSYINGKELVTFDKIKTEIEEHQFVEVPILDSVEQIDRYIDNYSGSLKNDTFYHFSIHSNTFEHPAISGGSWLIEGVKTNDEWEWQRATSYTSINNIIIYMRSKGLGVWGNWEKFTSANKYNDFYTELLEGFDLDNAIGRYRTYHGSTVSSLSNCPNSALDDNNGSEITIDWYPCSSDNKYGIQIYRISEKTNFEIYMRARYYKQDSETYVWGDWKQITFLGESLICPPDMRFADNLYGINMHNSDIIGANGIYFNDLPEPHRKGLMFYISDGIYNAIYAKNNEFIFETDRTLNSLGYEYKVFHSGNSLPISINSTAPLDTTGIWWDTTENKIKRYVDGAWQASKI